MLSDQSARGCGLSVVDAAGCRRGHPARRRGLARECDRRSGGAAERRGCRSSVWSVGPEGWERRRSLPAWHSLRREPCSGPARRRRPAGWRPGSAAGRGTGRGAALAAAGQGARAARRSDRAAAAGWTASTCSRWRAVSRRRAGCWRQSSSKPCWSRRCEATTWPSWTCPGPAVRRPRRALDRADLIMLVVQGDVRGVAAAREVGRLIEADGDRIGVVVRARSGPGCCRPTRSPTAWGCGCSAPSPTIPRSPWRRSAANRRPGRRARRWRWRAGRCSTGWRSPLNRPGHDRRRQRPTGPTGRSSGRSTCRAGADSRAAGEPRTAPRPRPMSPMRCAPRAWSSPMPR